MKIAKDPLLWAMALCFFALEQQIQAKPIQEAKGCFITQEKSPTNKNAKNVNSDCGPTSLAMAAKRWNKVPKGYSASPQGVEQFISYLRKLMTGKNNHQAGTNGKQVAHAAESIGIHASIIRNMTLDSLNKGLSHQNMVIAGGNPAAPGAYAQSLSEKQYKHFNGSHWILVVARGKNDHYIVDDPMSLKGPLKITSSEMNGYLHTRANEGVVLSK
jgi:hypothetical protein